MTAGVHCQSSSIIMLRHTYSDEEGTPLPKLYSSMVYAMSPFSCFLALTEKGWPGVAPRFGRYWLPLFSTQTIHGHKLSVIRRKKK